MINSAGAGFPMHRRPAPNDDASLNLQPAGTSDAGTATVMSKVTASTRFRLPISISFSDIFVLQRF